MRPASFVHSYAECNSDRLISGSLQAFGKRRRLDEQQSLGCKLSTHEPCSGNSLGSACMELIERLNTMMPQGKSGIHTARYSCGGIWGEINNLADKLNQT
jgi:hypothetical protein